MTEVRSPARALVAASASDKGRVRLNNEDLPVLDVSRGVYGVIDGIGGQAAGEIAAGIARDVILQRLARPLGTPAERVREALAIANNEIYSRAEHAPELRGMACVATLAIVNDGTLTIGHVGDTRLYKVRPAGLRKLTRDHSPIGEREDACEISETDAMRHPRRHEVFRDLGSAPRDKDEDEFVEIVVESFETDSAILLCSDGLTDMISSAAIEQVVRRHAGRPQEVADALVSAANEAGGRDNVTVVYAEGPGFACAMRRAPAATTSDAAEPGPAARADGGTSIPLLRPPSPPRRIARSRAVWFLTGLIAGGAAALAPGLPGEGGGRVLAVDGSGTTGFARIADAMSAARPGDVVRLEPGVYPERVVLREGVNLAARIPGTAAIVRPSEASGEVVGISVLGNGSSTVAGIRIESTPGARVDVGVRISGPGVALEQMELSGEMLAGIEVLPAAAVVVRGSWFMVQGPSLALRDESQATLTSSTVLGAGRFAESPFDLAPSSRPVLRQNVFAGFGADVVRGVTPAVRQQLLAGNYIIAAEPSIIR